PKPQNPASDCKNKFKMAQFLKKLDNQIVNVKLNSNETITGTFKCMDGALNIVLSDVELDGQLLSDVMIRGNNVLYISPITTKNVSTKIESEHPSD
ncbi:MAG: LSM domain-containing protein, partial [Flammeovirgaceae bacterium]